MNRSQRRRPRPTLQAATGLASARARVSRNLCAEAAAQSSVLELEQWTSLLLGRIWAHRTLTPGPVSADPMLVAGMPVLESFVEVGGSTAKTALAAMARLDRGGLGRAASELAGAIAASIPDWVGDVGTAGVVRAFVDRSPGDGEAFLLEAQPGDATPHMVAIFVDARLGGIAKRLALIRVIDPMEPEPQPPNRGGRRLGFRPVDPPLACRQVRAAIALTDETWQSDIGRDFSAYRALAIARLDHAGPLA